MPLLCTGDFFPSMASLGSGTPRFRPFETGSGFNRGSVLPLSPAQHNRNSRRKTRGQIE